MARTKKDIQRECDYLRQKLRSIKEILADFDDCDTMERMRKIGKIDYIVEDTLLRDESGFIE